MVSSHDASVAAAAAWVAAPHLQDLLHTGAAVTPMTVEEQSLLHHGDKN
jgi:hypothetical protein